MTLLDIHEIFDVGKFTYERGSVVTDVKGHNSKKLL